MAAILDNSIGIMHMRPQAIPLAMIAMRKLIYGLPFLSYLWVRVFAQNSKDCTNKEQKVEYQNETVETSENAKMTEKKSAETKRNHRNKQNPLCSMVSPKFLTFAFVGFVSAVFGGFV